MKRVTARKKTKVHINVKPFILPTLFLLSLGFVIYTFITINSVKVQDPTGTNGSHLYLLASQKSDSQKTLIVIERGVGKEKKISDVYMYLNNNTKNKNLLVYIPGWLYFAGLEEDFGNSVPISSLRYAGDFLQEGRGVEYAVWQLSQMLGIKFDDYIWFSSEGINSYQSIYGDLSGVKDSTKTLYKASGEDLLSEDFFKFHNMSLEYSALDTAFNIYKFGDFNNQISSNMKFPAILREILGYANKVRKAETFGIDLSYYKYSKEQLSEGGGQIRFVNTQEFDSVYRSIVSNLMDRELEKERSRIEVYNGSTVPGAAMQFGRKIENAGCDVVRYENAPKSIEKTQVYVSNVKDFKNSLGIVSEILASNYELIEGRPSFMTTGDIIIILGEDIKQMYSF